MCHTIYVIFFCAIFESEKINQDQIFICPRIFEEDFLFTVDIRRIYSKVLKNNFVCPSMSGVGRTA